MAKYRKVSTHVWNDARFRSLSDDAKLLFFFLLTHPQMTPLGAVRATIPGLAAELGWTEKGFREGFQEVSSKGMAKADEGASMIWLPKFLKHNSPENPNVVKSWRGGADTLPECDLYSEMIQEVRGYVEGLAEGFRKAFAEGFPEAFAKGSRNQEQEQEQDYSRRDAGASEESSKEYIWRAGVQLLMRANNGEQSARSIIGKWAKKYGEDAVASAVGRAMVAQPAEPKAWLTAALENSNEEEHDHWE